MFFLYKVQNYKLATAILLLLISITLGCSESVRRIPSSAYETPAFFESDTSKNSDMGRKSSQELVTSGYAYLAAGNMPLARLHFIYALRREPNFPTANIGLGDISYQFGDYPSALTYYRKAEESAAKSRQKPRGFNEGQSEHFKDSRSGGVDVLDAKVGQIRSLRQMGKLTEVEKAIAQAIKFSPDDIRVLNEKAIYHDLKGEEQVAANLYQTIAQKAPDQAAPFNNIGVSLLSQGKYPEAIINLNKAFILNEKDQRIRNNLGMAFALYGQEDQALKLFTKTIGVAAAWNNLGYIYMTQGKFDEAEIALNKAMDLNPKLYERAQENLDRLGQMRLAKQSEEVFSIQSTPVPKPESDSESDSTSPPKTIPVPAPTPEANVTSPSIEANSDQTHAVAPVSEPAPSSY